MTKARDLANAGTALTSVSATELGYLDGVTSAVQTQIDAKLGTTAASTTYQSIANNFAVGKNKIINGDFGVWQRGTSFTNPTNYTYNCDRWIANFDGTGATRVLSQQTFTPGTAPVAGYEGTYFYRWAQTVAGTGGTYNQLIQKIEDVRTFANQTATFSLWAKASANITCSIGVQQEFGTGGSSAVYSIGTTNINLTTSWQRFAVTMAIPSIAGKTIGTGSSLTACINVVQNSATTYDFWGVQLEAGSVATPFQTSTGTVRGELAACQRYYTRFTVDSAFDFMATGLFPSTTTGRILFPLPVQMRIAPTSLDTGGAFALSDGAVSYTATSPTIGSTTPNQGTVNFTTSGVTQFRPCILVSDNNASTYVGFNSEL